MNVYRKKLAIVILLITTLITVYLVRSYQKTNANDSISEISIKQLELLQIQTNQLIQVEQTSPTQNIQRVKTEVEKPAAAAPTTATKETWERIAACESTSNWQINTGNGYYGGLQFSATTWASAGGTKYAPLPHQASKEQQIEIADSWLSKTSWSQWGCAARIGIG
jgi:hypothetical protein